MSRTFKPKGRGSIPTVLMQMGSHIVYSEGSKTEPLYVKNIKKCIASKYRCNENDILIQTPSENKLTKNTLRLFEYAKKDVSQRIANGETINNVWIFFDKDDFSEKDFLSAIDSINRMNNSKKVNEEEFKYDENTNIAWHPCWSNESFELWLLLYFNYCDSKLNRKDYIDKINNIPKLKRINFKYKKNIENIHSILTENGGSIKKAMNFAKKLNLKNKYNNPSTGIAEFAEFFIPYLDE